MRFSYLLLLLFLLSPSLALSIETVEPVSASPQGWADSLSTSLSISYSAVVSAPDGMVIEGDANDLGDGAVVCPNTPLTIDAEVEALYAYSGVWEALFTAPANECPAPSPIPATPTPISTYSLSTYNQWKGWGEVQGDEISSSYALPLTVECDNGDVVTISSEVEGVLGPQLYVEVDGQSYSLEEGSTLSLSHTVGVGQHTIAIGGSVGLVVAAVYRGDSVYTAYYASQPFSIGRKSMTIYAEEASGEMLLVSIDPSTLSTLPQEVEVVVRNNGNVPMEAVSVSASPPLEAEARGGFGEPIQPGEEATLTVLLEGQLSPQPQLEILFESPQPYCGDVVSFSLPVAFQRGVDGGALVVVGGEEYEGRGNTLTVTEGESVTVTFRVCGQGSFTAVSERSVVGPSGTIYEDSSSVDIYDSCQDVATTSFVCTSGSYTVSHTVDVPGDSDQGNNVAEVEVVCSPLGVCTPDPAEKSLFPGSSFTSLIWCGSFLCDSVDATVVYPGLTLDYPTESSVKVSSSPDVEPGHATVRVEAEKEGTPYQCEINVNIVVGECIDFI